MMRRRGVLGGGVVALLGTAAIAAPVDLAFRVMRQGSEVGSHVVRFRAEPGGLLHARSETRVAVRMLGLTVYRYAHEVEESWRRERLAALDSRLDDNGRPGVCEARAEGEGLRVRGTAGAFLLPAEAAPLTWWRAATLLPGVPLFDPRRGLPVVPELRRRPDAGGQRVTLVGGEGAEVIYDGAGRWVGFVTTGEDGSRVTYEPA